MSDISKCSGIKCPIKSTCKRYLINANEYWQSYSEFKYYNGCEFYIKQYESNIGI